MHVYCDFTNIINNFFLKATITVANIPEMLQWEIKFLTNSITSRYIRRWRKFVVRKGCYAFERKATLFFFLKKKREN